MLSLHQLRCFLAAYEFGSLTAAAEELGYAQPSISEQIRLLERGLGVTLFTRVGRGVVPTTAGEQLREHAERTLASAEEARRAVQSVAAIETGTVRFGIFGIARLYAGAQLVADMLEAHPGVRVELVGQNSTEVQEQLRRGRIEAAMIVVANVRSEGLQITPVARDELVYISADPDRLEQPITPKRLADADVVMPDTTFRADDPVRIHLRQVLHEAGRNPQTRIEVEDVEMAVELVGMGLADSVIPRGAADVLLPRIAPHVGLVSLRPRTYVSMAVVHRSGAALSPATRKMIQLATRSIQQIAEPITPAGGARTPSPS